MQKKNTRTPYETTLKSSPYQPESVESQLPSAVTISESIPSTSDLLKNQIKAKSQDFIKEKTAKQFAENPLFTTSPNAEKNREIFLNKTGQATPVKSQLEGQWSVLQPIANLPSKYLEKTKDVFMEGNKQLNEAVSEVPEKVGEIPTKGTEANLAHPILKGTLGTITAIASPVIAAFDLATEGIAKSAEKTLPEPQAKIVGEALPYTFSLAHKAAASLGYTPEVDSNGDMLLSMVDFIIGGKALEVGGKAIKNVKDLKSIAEKASKGELSPEEQAEFKNGVDKIRTASMQDIKNEALKHDTPQAKEAVNGIDKLEEKKRLSDERDTELKQVQSQREELGIAQESPHVDMPENVLTVINMVSENKLVGDEKLSEASDYLYSEYKRLQELKSDNNRPFTTEQINEAMGELESAITEMEARKKYESNLSPELKRLHERQEQLDKADVSGVLRPHIEQLKQENDANIQKQLELEDHKIVDDAINIVNENQKSEDLKLAEIDFKNNENNPVVAEIVQQKINELQPLKPKENAVQINETSSLLQHAQEGVGEQGSERGTLEQGIEGVKTPETGQEENVIEELQKEIGTKNDLTKILQSENGLVPIEIPKDRAGEESLAAWENGTRPPFEIVEQLLSDKDIYDKSITPNDEPIMREYIRGLENRAIELNRAKVDLQEKTSKGEEGASEDLASINQQLLNHYDEYGRALQASQVGGNIWGKYGRERQLSVDDKGLLVNSINRIKTIYGDEIPEHLKQKLSDIQQRYDELLVKNEKIEKELKDKEAENVLLKESQTTRKSSTIKKDRKTSEQFKAERVDIIADMKKALALANKQTYATLPGVPQLTAIAPHVAKLVKSLAEEGVIKLDDVITSVHEAVKDAVEGISKDDIRDIISGKYNEKKSTRSDLSKQLADLRTQAGLKSKIEKLENGIEVETRKRGESSKEVKDLSKQLAEAKKQAKNEYANISASELKKQAESIQKKIDKGQFFKMPISKVKFENDPTWIKNNREKVNLMFKLKELEQEAFDSEKNFYMKSLDYINRWGRRVIFFGSNAVYTKLSSAAVLGSFVHRVPEQLLGKGNIKLFPEIAKRATMEGNVNAKNEAKFYQEFLNPKKFAKNTWDLAKTGETELSKELSVLHHKNHIPIVDLFAADTHIMIKDPVKMATFESALKYHLDWYADNGIDGTHPLMLESARQAAYKRAEYEIFQDNRKEGSAVNAFFNELEKSGIVESNMPATWDKVKGNAKYTSASLYHFFVPINTVPVNILRRVGLGLKAPLNFVEAISKNKALEDGIKNMTAEEANLLMVQLKKGQVGLAYWTLGFIVGGKIAGGLYTKYNSDKKRSPYKLKSNELKIGKQHISHNVQHNIQLTSLQMGATWANTYNHYIKNEGKSQMQALGYASAATAGSAIENFPSIRFGTQLLKAGESEYGGSKFADDLKRRVGVGKAKSILTLMGYHVK